MVKYRTEILLNCLHMWNGLCRLYASVWDESQVVIFFLSHSQTLPPFFPPSCKSTKMEVRNCHYEQPFTFWKLSIYYNWHGLVGWIVQITFLGWGLFTFLYRWQKNFTKLGSSVILVQRLIVFLRGLICKLVTSFSWQK